MIYILFPECNILIHVLWGVKQQNTVFAVGKSIFIVREICTGGRTPPLLSYQLSINNEQLIANSDTDKWSLI